MNIIWKGSPNFDGNRKTIDRIVIHWIVGNLAAADAVFAKTSPGTSAHYGIEDQTVHQYVQEGQVAYHAGNYAMNQRSVGIEHSAQPGRLASDATYDSSGQMIAQIAKRYNIPLDRQHVIKHNEVVATQCPGTMDIDRLIAIAKSYLGGGGNSMADMYKMKSGNSVDLANRASNVVLADTFDEVINQKIYIKKDEVEKNYVKKVDYENLQKSFDDYKKNNPVNPPTPVNDPALVEELRALKAKMDKISEAIKNEPTVIISNILKG